MSVTCPLAANHKYLFSAEWNSKFKQTPDNSLSAVGRGEGALVAEVPGQSLLGSGKHPQGHTLQSCAVC